MHDMTPLALAAIRNKPDMCRLLLQHGANISASCILNENAVMHAVSRTHLATMEVLMEFVGPEFDLDARCYTGDTAVMKAVRGNNAGGLKLLLDRGASMAGRYRYLKGKPTVIKLARRYAKYRDVLSVLEKEMWKRGGSYVQWYIIRD